jgi:hypothetical protein
LLIYFDSNFKMKILKGLTVLLITLSLGSCFDPPEFPVVPQIDYDGIAFKEGNATNRTDSLIITIKFKDGDGNLGLDPTHPDFNSGDFSNLIFYQANLADKPNLIPISTELRNVEHTNKQNQKVVESVHLLQVADPTKGKLVFPRTRRQAGFEFLPAYSCENYEYFRAASYAIEAKNKDILDKTALVDTLFLRQGTTKTATHYIVRDTLYFRVNPNHYNIEVDFLVKDPANPNAVDGFVEYNWRKEFCQQNLDGRFPFLTDDDENPLEGTIRYAMTTIGFKKIFTIKTLKLRVKIRDRLFNESNEITTPEFTLDSIRI